MERLAFARATVADIGEELRRSFAKRSPASKKQDGSWVTEVDIDIEKRVVEGIRKHFPHDAIIGEEFGSSVQKTASRDGMTWYIDPIDGTTNFAVGLPLFASALAYAKEQIVIGAAVSLPILNVVVWAERGKGVFWNNKILPSIQERSSDAPRVQLISYSDRSDVRVERFRQQFPGTRIFGSAVAAFCFLAQGSASACVALGLHPWDYAAGLLFAAEAGACVVDLRDGGPVRFPETTDLVLGSPEAVKVVLRTLENS